MSAKARRVRLIFSIPIMIFALGFPFPCLVIIQLAQHHALAFCILPGTEGMAGYKDSGFHLRASLKGQIGLTIFSLIGAGLIMLFS